MREKLLNHLNKKDWWHVPPETGEESYKRKGKFMASTYANDEFYGKPLNEAQKVKIKNPLIGTENEIAEKLGIPPQKEGMTHEQLQAHDRKWALKAIKMGHDAIVMVSPNQWKTFQSTKRLPSNMEIQDLTHMPEHAKFNEEE